MRQSEFKFFEVVEDTVEGIIAFVDCALFTLFHLAVVPHSFPQKWLNESNRKSFTKPFTTLAISVFVLYFSFAHIAEVELQNLYPAAFDEKPSHFRNSITLSRFFLYSIPIVIVLYWLSRLVSRLTTAADDSRANLASLSLYACSLQCVTVTIGLLCRPTFGVWSKLILLYGFIACVLIMWNALLGTRELRQIWKGCISLTYSLFSLVLIWSFVVVGFAIEIGVSPEGRKLVEEHRKQQFSEFIDSVAEATKNGSLEEGNPSYEQLRESAENLMSGEPGVGELLYEQFKEMTQNLK